MKKAIRRRGVPQEILSQLQLPLSELIRQTLLDTLITSGTIQAIEMLRSQQEALCGPRYKQVADRKAHRHGSTAGSLVMGGRRVTLPRPRVRSVAGREVELPAWTQWSSCRPGRNGLGRTRWSKGPSSIPSGHHKMILGVSTRGYSDSLEKLPVEVPERGKSRSAVSRRFVEGTRRRLVKLQRRDLSKLSLAVLMIDGIHFEDHVVLVALGFENDGKKHVLGLWEGATENSRACKALLENLASRGLQTNRSMLIVLDGAKALHKACRDVFGDRAFIQRCQEHKKRNVADHLPESMRPGVRRAMNQAYECRDAKRAKRQLEALAARLESEHPGAAASLREGLDDTLTVIELNLPERLQLSLRTTNPIDNLIGSVRKVSRRVKRWRGGRMMLRWCGAAVLDAEQRFRRIRGYREMPKLIAALRARDAELDEKENAA